VARSLTFTYTVTVVSSDGNKYAIDGNTQQYVVLFPGGTYKFDQADSSNNGHPLRFSETSNGTHNSGSEYTTGVTTAGTPGSSGAYTQIEVTSSTPFRLYYYCTNHSGMGGSVQVPNNHSASGRGLVAGGATPSSTNSIDYINIAVTGNAQDFGDLLQAQQAFSGTGNQTQLTTFGGITPGNTNQMQQVLFQSLGNSSDFGDLTNNLRYIATAGNKIKAITGGSDGGGPTAAETAIQCVIYATQGQSFDTGGDMTKSGWAQASAASPTRGIFAGRQNNDSYPTDSNIYNNTIDYVDFASVGTCSDFGDLGTGRKYGAGASNSTRMLIAGGDVAPGAVSNIIEYITMASTGNGTDFGDLSVARGMGFGHLASSTRAVFCGGSTGSLSNVMDYNTIGSTGNASDFGDLTAARQISANGSDSHGGLQ
jgi:plastocyanin